MEASDILNRNKKSLAGTSSGRCDSFESIAFRFLSQRFNFFRGKQWHIYFDR